MPNLPTFMVTDAVANRLMAAFSGQTDDNGLPITPQQAYKRWLRQQLTQYVVRRESEASGETLGNELV